MRDTLVLTVIGADKTGLVQSLAEKLSGLGANWEEARMARLAGQFAGILLVTIDSARTDELVAAMRGMESQGLQISARRSPVPPPAADHKEFRLQVTANDRPGIVRDVSRVLAERGVNVEELESNVTSAPMSGEPLFTARALLHVPPTLTLHDLRAGLESLTGELMVDLVPE